MIARSEFGIKMETRFSRTPSAFSKCPGVVGGIRREVSVILTHCAAGHRTVFA